MFDENIKFKYSWRPYQAKVLREVDKYIDDKKVNIVAAPGSGKTVLGLELARKLSNPVLILSPTVTIKNQWIDRFVTLFMKDGALKPDWISDNVYKLNYFNSITYQGLHYAYKRKLNKNKIDIEETDDEVFEENVCENIDIKEYDLVREIKKNKIKTIILDEAHHLKSEWWQSLMNVIDELEDITIISLTATPPYDIEYNEWKKYIKLCGNIDMEISVPELVEAKNLCPHQDYIYFSYPTDKEKAIIKEYESKVNEFISFLRSNNEFIEMIKNHPFIKYTENNIEQILEKTEFYSSMLIFLNSSNVVIDKEKVKILGHNKPIPNLDVKWIEILLQRILFENDEYFSSYIEILEEIKSKLNKIGAIEKKKVFLSKNTTLQKCFVNSISKLESINKIVNAEFKNLKSELRMVILTDFLRKEYLFEENIEVNKLGVFPILLNLLKQNKNINMAVLTGSIFMIPNSKSEKLLEIANDKGIDLDDIEFIKIEKVPSYSIVRTTNQNKNNLMKSISKLFSDGDVNIIIGTKSLLGEGWDEPSINSLILASFVGSYVLSNQMRGRAIRTNNNPNKTANVWHLVCVADFKNDVIENTDYEMLKRRFNSFVGIGYNFDVLENGIDRLDIIPKKFNKYSIDNYNYEVIKISDNRTEMYNRWFSIIDEFGGNNIKMSNQLETSKENIKNRLSIIQVSKLLRFFIIYLLLVTLDIASEMNNNSIGNTSDIRAIFVELIVIFLITVIVNIKFIIQCIRAIKYSMPKNKLKAVAKVVIKTLCDENIVKTNFENIKINVAEQKENINVSLSIDGVTTHENNQILNSIEEVFTNSENQRYIIINQKRRIQVYYNVPEILAINKELAERFHNNWKKYIGESKLIYTKSVEGRKILLEARKNTFNYVDLDKFTTKKKPISTWK